MKKYCSTCNIPLDFVLANPNDAWSTEYLMCPMCNGTYNIEEVSKCSCKYAHQDGKCKWPTLAGRLNQPFTSEKEALLQLQRDVPLSEYGLKRLKKLIEEEKNLP